MCLKQVSHAPDCKNVTGGNSFPPRKTFIHV
jgi:hypothetical protein